MHADCSVEPCEPPRFAILGSLGVAVLFAAISLGGLLIPTLYARETASMAVQAIAQDWFDLVVAVPSLLGSAIWASRGSPRGWLMLAGSLLYVVYTLLIYAFAVHLNALFLLYCAGLGLAVYSLISVARSIGHESIASAFAGRRPRRAPAAFLVVVGIGFGLLWLAQLVPAAITGEPPAELVEMGLLTNPVHVIDLSFIIPLHLIGGVLLWRGRSTGQVLAPALLAFGALMTASISWLTVLMQMRGVTEGGSGVAIAMALLAACSLVLLAGLLRHRPPAR